MPCVAKSLDRCIKWNSFYDFKKRLHGLFIFLTSFMLVTMPFYFALWSHILTSGSSFEIRLIYRYCSSRTLFHVKNICILVYCMYNFHIRLLVDRDGFLFILETLIHKTRGWEDKSEDKITVFFRPGFSKAWVLV